MYHITAAELALDGASLTKETLVAQPEQGIPFEEFSIQRSTIWHFKVSVMSIRATPGVAIQEGVSGSVVGVVPGTRCNQIPIAIRGNALDRWGIHLTGDLHPLSRGYFVGSCARKVVGVGEGIST